MRVFSSLDFPAVIGPRAIALGTFDGLHLGHKAVICAAVSAARERGMIPAVFTFSDNPSGGGLLLTREDKLELLEKWGVQEVYAPPFPRVRDIPAQAFLREILRGRCAAAALFCGEDFRFGKNAAGDVRLLAGEPEVKLTVIPPVLDGEEKISSTRVRAALREHRLPQALAMLGHGFGFRAQVIHGSHIGTGLGFPTINQRLPEGFFVPPFGVYSSRVLIDGQEHWGVTNIGVKPTVGSDGPLAETWLPEFSGDLYGKTLALSLRAFLREERKFASLEELKAMVLTDARAAKLQILVEGLEEKGEK